MKKRIRSALRNIILFFVVMLFFPSVCCMLYHLFNPEMVIGAGDYSLEKHYMGKDILIDLNGLYKSIDVEEYVAGIMPGVINAEYNMEALKTQVVLVRTNVLKEMEEKNTKDALDLSYEYYTKEERERLWGRKNYNKCEQRIERAVAATSGKVIRKENNLIMAMYHEVSIGKTADASEILGEDISYLKSVDSSSDVEAKDYMNLYEFSYGEIRERVKEYSMSTDNYNLISNDTIKGNDVRSAATDDQNSLSNAHYVEGDEKNNSDESNNEAGNIENSGIDVNGESIDGTDGKKDAAESDEDTSSYENINISIEESTENGFVKKVSVDGTIYSGQEIVDMLELASDNFYIEESDKGVRIVCLGKGSCLGVSQYGANMMAGNGVKMEDIITYYYEGVSIENAFPD